ncbi:MAG: GatB/YqeY domain-containing protein [Planctomycetes bacterium]|nr:GatB/YqeY domain-containing protein [Planctomycetota bacterium]
MLKKINDEIKQAMRNKEKLRLQTLRSLVNDFKNLGIEKRGKEGLTAEVSSPAEYLSDAEMIKVIQSAAKSRKESYDQFIEGGRQDLAATEMSEFEILSEFLPKQLDDAELEEIVKAAIAETSASSMADMGGVMKIAQVQIAGRADGKRVSAVVRQILG